MMAVISIGALVVFGACLAAVCVIVIACGRTWTQRVLLVIVLAAIIGGGIAAHRLERDERDALQHIRSGESDPR
jgi:UPF0716 family protein affecting phage T7 exclusion